MVFWSIVVGIILIVLLITWRYDRRRRFQGDVSARAHGGGVAQGEVENYRLPHLPPGPGGSAKP
jgi:hypothetical protein